MLNKIRKRIGFMLDFFLERDDCYDFNELKKISEYEKVGRVALFNRHCGKQMRILRTYRYVPQTGRQFTDDNSYYCKKCHRISAYWWRWKGLDL